MQGYSFPIKGTFYYAADLVLDEDLLSLTTPLKLQAEPDNPYDHHALQIFLPTRFKSKVADLNSVGTAFQENLGRPGPLKAGLLLGYVPRSLASALSQPLRRSSAYRLTVTRAARLGKRIEIECLLEIKLPWYRALNLRLLCLWIEQRERLNRVKRYLIQRE